MTRPLGLMRHVAEVYKGTQPRKDYTAENEAPDLQMRMRVSIRPLSGRELATAREVYPLVTHLITGRWNQTIKPDMWLDVRGRVFQVVSVTNIDELNHTANILAIETA